MTDVQDRVTGTSSAHIESLKESITALGATILQMKTTSEAEQSEKIDELERRYSDLRREFEALELEEKSSSQTSDKAQSSDSGFDQFTTQAQESWQATQEKFGKAYEDMKAYVTDERNQEAFKKSSQEVGEGFSKAWNDISSAFEKGIDRFRSDSKKRDSK